MLGMDIVLVIAGNKIDLEKNRSVNRDDAEGYVIAAIVTIIATGSPNLSVVNIMIHRRK